MCHSPPTCNGSSEEEGRDDGTQEAFAEVAARLAGT